MDKNFFTNRRAKYGNRKCEFGGIMFDSKREMERYVVLKSALDNGDITNLEVHRKFELIPAIKEKQTVHLKTKDKEIERTVQLPITYTADFTYSIGEKFVVEDVKISKHLIPKEFSLKAKLMRWRYGIEIRLVYKATEQI